jgi:hypothetical protein
MTNAEATITENAATVAEQGAHVAPEKASSKKGAKILEMIGRPKGATLAEITRQDLSTGFCCETFPQLFP